MRIRELFETATSGSTSAGNIAMTANSISKKNIKKLKNKDFTTKNTLESDTLLFGGTILKR